MRPVHYRRHSVWPNGDITEGDLTACGLPALGLVLWNSTSTDMVTCKRCIATGIFKRGKRNQRQREKEKNG